MGTTSFERMAGVISQLANVQNQRRELDLRESQLKENQAQFARSMGFQEKSEGFKNAMDILNRIGAAGSESRSAITELAQALNISPDQMAAFQHFAVSAPETIEQQRNAAAQRGQKQGASAFDAETAAAALTGQNQGQLGVSQFIQQLANGARSNITPAMARSFANKNASGQTTLQATVDQNILSDPKMLQAITASTAGTGLTAAEQGNLNVANANVDVARAGVRQRALEVQQQIAARLAEIQAAGKGSISPENMINAQRLMTDQLKVIADPNVDDTFRTQAQAQYNMLAKQFGLDDLMITDQNKDMGPAWGPRRVWQGSVNNPALPGQPAPLPMPGQNPLMPFVRPGAVQPYGNTSGYVPHPAYQQGAPAPNAPYGGAPASYYPVAPPYNPPTLPRP